MSKIHNLIIIGAGPAGLTAAIYAGRANLSPIVIEGSQPGGQLMGTSEIENWPGNISIFGPKLMMNMREHAQAYGAEIVGGEVVRVDFSSQPFQIWTSKEKQFQARAVIIATGATPKKLGCAGEQQQWGRGVSSCAVCDAAFYKDKRVIVVGGGDTAAEEALFLTKFTKSVTIVHILPQLTASAVMREKVVKHPDIKIIYQATVVEIKGDGSRVTGVVIQDQKKGDKRELPVDGVFVAIGLNPNTGIFKGQLLLNSYGYISVHDHTKTSVPGVFAAGDVFDDRYRQAITSAGSGCQASLDAERFLSSI